MKRLSMLLLLATCASVVSGASVSAYKAHVKELRSEIADRILEIRDSSRDADEWTRIRDRIRGALLKRDPRFARIETNGSVVEIDERWLAERVRSIENNPASAEAVLIEIDDRLAAIEFEIGELERAVAKERTKDQDKEKIAEILRRVEFQKPEPPKESWLDRLRKSIEDWLSEHFPKVSPPRGDSTGMRTTSVVLQILLYALVIGAVGLIVYKFAPLVAARFRRAGREEDEDRVVLGERIGADQDSGTLFGDAERLAREGDLRGAVRKGYIAILCELADRKLVGLARHKTNRDYLRDIRKHRPLFDAMRGLTNRFERHWYGSEEVKNEDWEEFRREYQNTRSVGS